MILLPLAPASGSTINHPIRPPKIKFPAMYQPVELDGNRYYSECITVNRKQGI